MKREHKELSEDKSLILHLPLDLEHGLTDLVSGQSLILNGNGSIVWDNTVQMFKIIQPSVAEDISTAYLPLSVNPATLFTDEFTVIGQIQRITTTSGKYIASCGVYDTTNNMTLSTSSFTIAPSTTTNNVGSWPNGLHKIGKAISISKNSFVMLIDGVGTNLTVNSSLICSNYSFNAPYKFCFGCSRTAYGTVFTDVQYYLKDYYIYNRYLTEQEIRQIQGF